MEMKSLNEMCYNEKLYDEVILYGGLNAGTYTDAGKITLIEECQNKCCQDSTCDVVFTLNNTCYLVTCSNIASCQPKLAKPTDLHPRVGYVSRINGEGVRRTVFGGDSQPPWSNNQCPGFVEMKEVTVKNGLIAGNFTNVGKTDSIEVCYNACCQQEKCHMAFLLIDNCFTISCFYPIKKMVNDMLVEICDTEKASKTQYAPKAAHIFTRIRKEEFKPYVTKPTNEALPTEINSFYNIIKTTTLNVPFNQVLPWDVTIKFCPLNRHFKNVVLAEGFSAGIFTEKFGLNGYPLSSIFECQTECCKSDLCDLAAIINEKCFMVSCHYLQGCLIKTDTSVNWEIMYVRNITDKIVLNEASNIDEYVIKEPIFVPTPKQIYYSYNIEETTSTTSTTLITTPTTTTLKGSNFTTNKILDNSCMSLIQENLILKNSLVNLKHILLGENITSSESCRNKCCFYDQNFTCHLAFYTAEKCYGISCDSNNCEMISSDSDKRIPKIIMVRNFTTETQKEVTTTAINFKCKHGDVMDNVTFGILQQNKFSLLLTKSFSKINYELLGSNISNINECIKSCCDVELCNAAVLMKNKCYGVECQENPKLCQPTKRGVIPNEKYQIAFLSKDSSSPEGNILSATVQANNNVMIYSLLGIFTTVCFICISAFLLISKYKLPKKKPKRVKKIKKPKTVNKLEELLEKASKKRIYK